MFYLALANIIVLIHGLFIAFVIAGGILAWRWPKLVYLHLPTLAWGLWIEISHGICPLTPMEKYCRLMAGEAGYEQGFIEHYLLPVIYPAGLTHETQYLLAGILTLINLIAYIVLIKRHFSRKNPIN